MWVAVGSQLVLVAPAILDGAQCVPLCGRHSHAWLHFGPRAVFAKSAEFEKTPSSDAREQNGVHTHCCRIGSVTLSLMFALICACTKLANILVQHCICYVLNCYWAWNSIKFT